MGVFRLNLRFYQGQKKILLNQRHVSDDMLDVHWHDGRFPACYAAKFNGNQINVQLAFFLFVFTMQHKEFSLSMKTKEDVNGQNLTAKKEVRSSIQPQIYISGRIRLQRKGVNVLEVTIKEYSKNNKN